MRPILLTGANGTLGRAFTRLSAERDLAIIPLGRRELDIADPMAVQRAVTAHRPWAVINAAGHVQVDAAEEDAEKCWRENVTGPMHLAQACAVHAIPLLAFSSDLVFDGTRSTPYVESHATRALSLYGRSKVVAETCTRELHGRTLMIRTAAFFSPWDQANFAHEARTALDRRAELQLADDLTVSPTYLPDLVHACLDLLLDGERGVWHLSNGEALTWFDAGCRVAEVLHLNADRFQAVPSEQLRWRAPRPRFSALGSERGMLLPSFSDALSRWAAEVR